MSNRAQNCNIAGNIGATASLTKEWIQNPARLAVFASGVAMSIMHLLKQTFMAHGWTLALMVKPLVNHYFQAWRYVPVIPSIYFSFRPHDVYNLNPVQLARENMIDPEIDELPTHVHGMYSKLSAGQLYALSHIRGGLVAQKIQPRQARHH